MSETATDVEMACQEPDIAGLTHAAVNRFLGEEPGVL